MNEDHHQQEAFEAELTRFRPTPVPTALREGILANACLDEAFGGQAAPRQGENRRPLLRLYAGALAAVWLLIFGFWLATPRVAPSSAYAEAEPESIRQPKKSLPPLPHGDMSQPPRAYMATVCQINHLLGESQ